MINEVEPRDREYTVIRFKNDFQLYKILNRVGQDRWTVETIHFNWWRGGKVVLWRERLV